MAGVSFLSTLTSLRLRPHSPRPSLAFAAPEISSVRLTSIPCYHILTCYFAFCYNHHLKLVRRLHSICLHFFGLPLNGRELCRCLFVHKQGVVCCYRRAEDAGEADERCVYHRRDVLRCVGAVVGMVLPVSTMSDDNVFAIHRSILLLFHHLKFLTFGS